MEKISFIIPCYRSEKTLPVVIDEVCTTMEKLSSRYDYDIILVNDASPDGTADVIKGLCEKNERISGISFAKNFGQHAALMAGFRYSDGDICVALDDDGQTPADQVERLLDKLDEGVDVVYAKYDHKKHSGFRNFGSKVNECMLRVMLNKPKELYVSSYFAVRRFVVDEMIRYENSYPYVIGLVLRSTGKIANVNIDHRARMEGSSGYNLIKLLGLWFNGFTAFSVKPLRIATFIGAFSAAIGFLYGVFVIVRRLIMPVDQVVIGFAAMMSAIVFFGGMILLTLGLIGEYIGRMYISMNNSPQYVIRDSWNIDK
ncbi:MAG: glycosyltransferase family 2 protein [Lachnospiraceae bacterium]|nr:glycosyltransferase family 2 protein [Lachnospiraceae bacterium]